MTDPQPKPPIDWPALADELTKYWKVVAGRVGDGLQHAATDAKNGDYNTDRFLEDVKDFWNALAYDIGLGIDNWKTYIEHRGDGTP
jgi:hypothetical protein